MAPTTMAPIFVVGVPRSGTTLLAAMLNAHPRIAISPETFFLEWALRRRDADLSHAADFERFWDAYTSSDPFAALGLDPELLRGRFQESASLTFGGLFAVLLDAYAESRHKPRGGEKTPRHYLYVDVLLEWFPGARVVFVVRDPRAVAASLLLVPWASDNVEEHAWRWRHGLELLSRFERDERVAAMRYEDLVTNPRQQLERLCAHVEEPFDEAMLEFGAGAAALVAGEAHKRNVLRPLSKESLHRWQEQLDARQAAAIEHICADQMATRGYRRSGRELGLGERVAVRARQVARQAGRARRRVIGAGRRRP